MRDLRRKCHARPNAHRSRKGKVTPLFVGAMKKFPLAPSFRFRVANVRFGSKEDMDTDPRNVR